ncbi:MAG: hypothetical protein HYT87_05055 [Nitrospirae bacterium]|nr:hypothetical protein [Nitrospirota bacterium]
MMCNRLQSAGVLETALYLLERDDLSGGRRAHAEDLFWGDSAGHEVDVPLVHGDRPYESGRLAASELFSPRDWEGYKAKHRDPAPNVPAVTATKLPA